MVLPSLIFMVELEGKAEIEIVFFLLWVYPIIVLQIMLH